MSTDFEARWRKARLCDHATIKARLGWKGLKAEEYVSEGPAFLAAPNLKGGRIDFDNVAYIPEWRYQESPEIQLREGDILLVKDGSTLGFSSVVRRLPMPSTVNGSIAVIRPNTTLDSSYLYYFINGQEFQKRIWSKRAGLGVPHLFQGDLRGFEVSIPSLVEQQSIAEVLLTLDRSIEQTETLVAKYQSVKAGLMADLFTRGVTSRGQLRPARTSAPNLYRSSPIGWIPKEWDVLRFSETISSAVLGVSLRGTRNSLDQIPLIKMGNLRWGDLDFSEVELLARGLVADERQLLRIGDFLFNTRNTPELVGKTAVYQGHFPVCTFDNNILCVRFKTGIDSRFVSGYMSQGVGKQRVSAMATGTTSVAAIYWSALSRFMVPKPADEREMRMISDYVDELTGLIELEQRQAAKLQHTKNGLLHDLLTARVNAMVILPGVDAS